MRTKLNLRCLTPILTVLALPSLPGPAGAQERADVAMALVGATLVDGTGSQPIADAVVLLRGGRIECAGARESCNPPDGIDVVDLTGRFLAPGIVDAHVHFSQTGWADGRPDSLDVRPWYPYSEVQARLRARPQRFFRSYLCSGVTAVFDVGGYPWTWELQARSEADSLAPHVAAAGPLLSTLDFWLNLPGERQFIHLADAEAARAGAAYIAAHGAAAVKVWFIPARAAEEMDPAVLAAGEEARRLGIPLIVHATGLREAKVALRAGAHLLVHSVWDQPVDQELIDLALQNRTVYCPTLTVRSGYQRMFEAVLAGEPPAIDDPNGCVDSETRVKLGRTAELGRRVSPAGLTADAAARRARALEEEMQIGAANLLRLHRAGVPIAMGTDAGNPLTLHGPSIYAEMEAMQGAGLTAMEVLVASTLGGARAMRRADDLGSVEAGKVADLLVLDRDPATDIAAMRSVRYVVRGGVLRTVEELGIMAAAPAP